MAEHSRACSICICADDFGQRAGINEAVLRLVHRERVHAVGCLVGAPAWASGSAHLRDVAADRLDAGLHLDFTEAPLLHRPARPLPALIADSSLGRLDAAAVAAEIHAQLDAFEQAMGRPPAFVDGHQHVHQLPVIRQQLLLALQARRYGRSPWLRSTRHARAGAFDWKPRLIEALGAGPLAAACERSGYRQNGRLLGVYDFTGGEQRYAALLRGWLQQARQGDLLMCHPGLGTDAQDPVAVARAAEYAVLASPAIGELLEASGIRLRPMSRILALPGRGHPP
ncbi:ChbG/HpnK family deacetylase [Ramlibacter tataouinensis]|uniref:ChbG/HpnK family deacetylase n=1 Tax=Ramlibacter tataouinensis TaxID=94132 RepID=UPI0022F38BDA|nr:ChbG/HpnK family deacetylase [Ramlibacter tataouinensis]WBY02594.1 ChbG/HpnK family deacetylase [Ramlibacter tataouinensis]